jgi:hypothetical protein
LDMEEYFLKIVSIQVPSEDSDSSGEEVGWRENRPFSAWSLINPLDTTLN